MKIFKLHILQKARQKSSLSQQFARNCVKISTEFRIFVEGARRLVRIRYDSDFEAGILSMKTMSEKLSLSILLKFSQIFHDSDEPRVACKSVT